MNGPGGNIDQVLLAIDFESNGRMRRVDKGSVRGRLGALRYGNRIESKQRGQEQQMGPDFCGRSHGTITEARASQEVAEL